MANDQTTRLCACGCGRSLPVTARACARFITGHYDRGPKDIWERIRAKCVWDGDCFVWTGVKTKEGYGFYKLGDRTTLTHRLVYEYFRGPIPEGLTIDHVKSRGCRMRACCNIEHLEAVTFRENVLRGTSFAAKNAQATHCPKGHEYNDANIKWYQGRRYCRPCHVADGRARRRRNRERKLLEQENGV